MFTLVSYSTPSQKKFHDACENWGVKEERRFIPFKLNIKDDNFFHTGKYMRTIKIFTNHKKSLKNVYALLIKKTSSNCQVTYQKELYLLFEKSGNFFYRVNIETGLNPPLLFDFIGFF